MANQNMIAKLKKAGLAGRGGAAFPTHAKWQMVKQATAAKKFVVCNCSEGEPGVFKDKFILDNYLAQVMAGVKLAMKTVGSAHGIFYLRPDYFPRYKDKIMDLAAGAPITAVKKYGGYLAGEETVVCEVLEHKRAEPRLKPPFPSQAGYLGYPTLINNVETFYYAARIAAGEYGNTRFYSISGAVNQPGVYELPLDWPMEKVLRATGNYPRFDFFVQAGGGVCGRILLSDELNQPVCGQGALVVYNRARTNLYLLMKKWADFFLQANCDKCVPCREGLLQLARMIKQKKIDRENFRDIIHAMENASLCGLGKTAAVPFRDITDKLLK